MNTPLRLTVAIAAAAALAGTGYTVAQAASPSPGTPPAAVAVNAATAVDGASTAPTRHHRRLLTAAERAQLKATGHTTVIRHTRKHGDVTLNVQTGYVGNASGQALTVVSRGGYVGRFALTPATVVRQGGVRVSTSTVKAGYRVLVVATADGTAQRIIIRRAEGNRSGAAA